jgi:hypothetical protein
MGILLEFIPARTTGERQPLDRRIFGNLNGRRRERAVVMSLSGHLFHIGGRTTFCVSKGIFHHGARESKIDIGRRSMWEEEILLLAN